MGWIVAIISVAALFLLGLFFAYRAFRMAFFSRGTPGERERDPYSFPKNAQYEEYREQMTALIAEMEAIPFESVTVTSFDGTALFGRYYHRKDGAPLHIQFHGYHGAALRDFCGGNRLVREMDHNSLVVDQRAHGKSGGSVIAFGVTERQDCLCWIRYACDRFGPRTPIFLSGVSMGAATVLMAAGLPLPENVRGILADCPYSSPEAIIKKVAREKGLPPALSFPFARLGARLFGHFSVTSASAVAAVRQAKIPILLIHGEADRFVPCEMSREIAAACRSPIRLETFPGAGHGLSYMKDTARYERITREFLTVCGAFGPEQA